MSRTSQSLLALLIVLFAGCGESNESAVLAELRSTENIEDFQRILSRNRVGEEERLRLLLSVVEENLGNQENVVSYGKVNIALKELNLAAKSGMLSKDAIPTLLNALSNQLSIHDTIVTSETLLILTGLDTGYDQQFVQSYTVEDEPLRLEKIEKWQAWYDQDR